MSLKKNTVLRAYKISDRTGSRESCAIVYALTARDARRGGYIDDVEYINLAAERAPEFDSFATLTGRPNLRDKLERGWWQECGGCHSRITLEGDETDATKIIAEDDAFCNDRCQAKAQGRDRGYEFRNAEQRAEWGSP